MKRSIRTRAEKVGLPPGTLVHVGEAKVEEVTLALIDYGPDQFEEREIADVAEIHDYLSRETVTWINVPGVHDVDLVERVGAVFDIHPLVLEDVLNTHQRPKAESYDHQLFVVLKMLRYDTETEELDVEQMSLVLGANYVITFQEKPGDVFDPVRDRIRRGKGRVRTNGPDYLAYALLDVIVDHYFLALEDFGEEIEAVEESLISDPQRENLEEIFALKRVMVTVRKAIWPLRELVMSIERAESELIADTTEPYLRDVYDHTVQVIDTVETYRDLLSGYVDMYLSSVSHRMNEVMKVLTIIATIFIPLTFLAGIYGMNFEYMPELKWRWGYPALWAGMITLGAGMLVAFRKRRWL